MIEQKYFRKKTRKIKIKDMAVGGDAPISIQSLTNTQTKDIKGTVLQIQALEKEGVEIIRSAIRDIDDAK
ncbi:MAG: flavodoxin-dependent (E)-4-hydroxy-3-methylbut-2-enyl-diphosphate synthase, partial [Tissierellia bacterium]|nr:flavodoxin-dependent (E)-4-hydroxy-3-methylbut-2-enyl-diphosphate synthase [Tissierellia bacterium]